MGNRGNYAWVWRDGWPRLTLGSESWGTPLVRFALRPVASSASYPFTSPKISSHLRLYAYTSYARHTNSPRGLRIISASHYAVFVL